AMRWNMLWILDGKPTPRLPVFCLRRKFFGPKVRGCKQKGSRKIVPHCVAKEVKLLQFRPRCGNRVECPSALQTSAADCAILVLFQSRFPPARHGLAKNDQRSLGGRRGLWSEPALAPRCESKHQ